MSEIKEATIQLIDYDPESYKGDIAFFVILAILQGGTFSALLHLVIPNPFNNYIPFYVYFLLQICAFLPSIYSVILYKTANKNRPFSLSLDKSNKTFIFGENQLSLNDITKVTYTDYTPTSKRGVDNFLLWEFESRHGYKFYFVIDSSYKKDLKDIFLENCIKTKFVFFKSIDFSMFLTILIFVSFFTLLSGDLNIFKILLVAFVFVYAVYALKLK